MTLLTSNSDPLWTVPCTSVIQLSMGSSTGVGFTASTVCVLDPEAEIFFLTVKYSFL